MTNSTNTPKEYSNDNIARIFNHKNRRMTSELISAMIIPEKVKRYDLNVLEDKETIATESLTIQMKEGTINKVVRH